MKILSIFLFALLIPIVGHSQLWVNDTTQTHLIIESSDTPDYGQFFVSGKMVGAQKNINIHFELVPEASDNEKQSDMVVTQLGVIVVSDIESGTYIRLKKENIKPGHWFLCVYGPGVGYSSFHFIAK